MLFVWWACVGWQTKLKERGAFVWGACPFFRVGWGRGDVHKGVGVGDRGLQ